MKSLSLLVHETRNLGHPFRFKMYKYSCRFISEITVFFPGFNKTQSDSEISRLPDLCRRCCHHVIHSWAPCVFDNILFTGGSGDRRSYIIKHDQWTSQTQLLEGRASPGQANLSYLIISILVSIAIKITQMIRVIVSVLILTSVLLQVRASCAKVAYLNACPA